MSSKTPQAIRGTQDIFGAEAEAFAFVVETFERVRKLYRFRRVEMPVFEKTGVFLRSLGETTDVVSKEMYTFDDRSGESLTLRPEFTAGIARAFLSNGWQQYAPARLATHGPAFRYERPQKGRFRQFHQIDAEIIGAAEPQADVEAIAMADQVIRELGLSEGASLRLNTLGDQESRLRWRDALVKHFKNFQAELSDESLVRLEKNPLRILDSKDPRDRPAADSAPAMVLSGAAEDFFGKVRVGLEASGIAYTIDPFLVRGLDYYRHTAFEFVTDRLGAQGQLVGGGRYDGLIETLGGPATPAVGWAAGIERLAMLAALPEAPRLEVVVIAEADGRENAASASVAGLRQRGITAEAITTGAVKKRFDKAIKLNPRQIYSLRDDGYEQRGRDAQKDELDRVREIISPILSRFL